MTPALTFPRAARLLCPRDFSRVFDKADYKAGNEAILLLAKDNDLGLARIGFVISKKNVRSAVKRNALRRQLREAFRLRHPLLPAFDLVILTRKNPVACNPKALRPRFEDLLERLVQQYRKRHGFSGPSRDSEQR